MTEEHNSFLSEEELSLLNLKKYGRNIKISRKSSFYSTDNIELGNNVRIDDFCILSGNIKIGDYVHIAAYSAIYGGTDGVEIGDFCNISSRVCIYSVSDDYSGESMTSPLVSDEYKNTNSGKVIIEKDVIIGSTSVVLPNIILREGGAFGSFSFINRSTEPWKIYAGVPVRVVKERSKNMLKLQNNFENKCFKDKDTPPETIIELKNSCV